MFSDNDNNNNVFCSFLTFIISFTMSEKLKPSSTVTQFSECVSRPSVKKTDTEMTVKMTVKMTAKMTVKMTVTVNTMKTVR